ncbi:MAG: hypothetical protein HZA54_18865 [Planctomycetes bacterium]|nr:hypothetical protein [Planctomycetota bacterium]
MERGDIQAWLSNKECLATRIASSDVKGLLRKRLSIPSHTIAWLAGGDGKPRIAREGEEVTGKFEAVLVKLGELPVRFRFAGLRSKDEVPVDVNATLYIQLDGPSDQHLGDFCRNLFSRGDTYVSSDVTAYLNFDVKKDLSGWIASKDADALSRVHEHAQAGDQLKETLGRSLQGKGLAFRKLGELDVDSPELKRHREGKQRDRAPAPPPEVDPRELERHREKLGKLVERLQSESLPKLLEGIKDEKARALLYTNLVELDLSRLPPGEATARLAALGEDAIGILVRALGNGVPAAAAAPAAAPAESPLLGLEPGFDRKTRWLLAVSGMTVFAFDADAGKPIERFRFEEPLRSARVLRAPDQEILVAGGKRSVFVRPLGEDRPPQPFHFPTGKKPKGGTNSAAVYGEYLFATHSEFGVARWKLAEPGSIATLICPEATAGNQTTRGVTVTPEGRLYFASGPSVFSVDLTREPLQPVQHMPQAQGAVTALALGKALVFASCGDGQEGSVVAWKLGEPADGRAVLRRNDPVLAVRLAKIGGVPHVVYATRDHSLYARMIGQYLETPYDAGEYLVSMVEAASDILCAVDQTGMHILFWHASSPRKPFRTLEVSQFSEHPVYDVTLRAE